MGDPSATYLHDHLAGSSFVAELLESLRPNLAALILQNSDWTSRPEGILSKRVCGYLLDQ